jgi:hypothetical protein
LEHALVVRAERHDHVVALRRGGERACGATVR